MSKTLCHAGVAVSAKFASPSLRRACIAHRASVLKEHSARRYHKSQPGNRRGYAAAVSNDTPKAFGEETSTIPPTSVEETRLSSSSTSNGRQAHPSITKLDPYLPLELRSGTWLQNLSGFEGVRDPATLPEVLKLVDNHFSGGVLASIALDQGRWPAFLHLAEALIEANHAISSNKRAADPEESVWSHQDATFPSIFDLGGMIELRAPEVDAELNSNVSRAIVSKELTAVDDVLQLEHRNAMDLLWRSLGRVTLHATDCERETSEYMMSYVHRILSIMHRENRMHPAIYHFDSEQIPKVYRKSPFLHLMSSRIMTVISDSAWKANENQIIDNYTWMGAAYASSGGLELKDLYPNVRAIGPETWLDLILWSCVHGGHVNAGASILRDIARRKKGDQWTSISWDALLDANLEKNDAISAKKLKDRLKKVAGGHEGYSRDEPIVSFPKKTISSEVVAALIANMAATSEVGVAKAYASNTVRLENMIMGPGISTNKSFWNLVATHFIDFGNTSSESTAAFLGLVSDVVSIQTYSSGRTDKLNAARENRFEYSDIDSALGPVYQHVFASLVDLGDVNRALRAFSKLQNWLDERKQRAIDIFFSMRSSRVNEALLQEDEKPNEKSLLEEFHMPVPVPTLAKFLDLLTEHGLFDLGIWLLSSTDADGPIVSLETRNSAVFQPALLRFAVAVGDTDLVHEIAERMQKMEFLALGLLHPLLQAQIEMRKFRQAESILSFVSKRDLGTASAEDIMLLARQILILEGKTDRTSKSDLEDASSLLNAILLKQYVPRRSPHLPIDLRAYHELNQLSRILSSVGGAVKQHAGMKIFEPGRYSGGARISADTFDIILGAVVQVRGPYEAKTLFDRWCVPTYENTGEALYSDDYDDLIVVQNSHPEDELVVLPTKRTILTILKPLVDNLNAADSDDTGPKSKNIAKPLISEVSPENKVGRPRPLLPFEPETLEDELEGEDKAQGIAYVPLRSDIALDERDVHLLQWGVDCLAQMGMTGREIAEELPGLVEEQAERNTNERENEDTQSS